ncbi:zinc finger protein 385D isoform X2 [Alosa sapidissima]|uniref:zinc finger protein 385D isoform X2 n=1 Tax=Alosa sapidissima TaxID=34773 RepID=UPI001C08BFAB|nr:zinc finger protein 385D isoform X2 [Alosa sapidissima]
MESMYLGNTCQGTLLPTLMRPPLPAAMQPGLGIKQFLPFSLEPTSGVSLFPSFSAMDPVQKAVIHHTFGVAPSPKRKYISCGVCQLRFNSQSQALAHFKGTKHAKKLKALDSPKCKQKGLLVARETSGKETPRSFSPAATSLSAERKDGGPAALVPHVPASVPLPLALPPASSMSGGPGADGSPAAPGAGDDGIAVNPASPAGPTPPNPQTPEDQTAGEMQGETEGEMEKETEAEETETEEEKAKRLLYCSLCKVAVNSPSQLEAHNSGTKHKTMLEARSGTGSIKSFPRPGVKAKVVPPTAAITGLQNKTFHCETCDVHVNSETQLKQHISSRRHKDRAAGKPAKPKYSPYTKPPRGQTKQPGKLSLGKELCQALPAGLMPSHLAAMAAAAAAINSAFPMRSSATPSLFQTQPLPAALLRPAPGPVRTAHTPVLFAPY